jgi:LysR family nitrogen assimilation transcriptional regulator
MRALVHVADQRSFSRAAAVMRMTQPALSRQIRLLEQELGTKLFHRHGHGVSMTDSGRLLFERFKRILGDVEQLRTEVGDRIARPGVTGSATLGVPSPLAWRFAEPFFERFTQAYPGISLRIVEGFSAFLHEWMLSGTIDLAILYGPRPSKIIAATEILTEDLYAIGPPSWIGQSSITIAELSKHTLIVPHPPHVIRTLAREAGCNPPRFIEVDALSLMIELAHSGKGFSILPITAVRLESISGYTSVLRIEKPSLSWVVSLCRNDLKPITPAAEALFGAAKAEMLDMVHSGRWDARLLAGI